MLWGLSDYTSSGLFFRESNENRVTMAGPGMVGMFLLLPMWRGGFIWWDSSQCATGPRSVCQLLQQLLLILWGQLLVGERRGDASITHPRCWNSLTRDVSVACQTSRLYWKKNHPIKQDYFAINSCPHHCLMWECWCIHSCKHVVMETLRVTWSRCVRNSVCHHKWRTNKLCELLDGN